MAYDAVTFDTQTVMSNSFNFGGGLLRQFTALRHEPIEVIVSEIVRSEILKHLTTNTKAAADALDNAIRKGREHDITALERPVAVDRAKAHSIAHSRLQDYLIELNCSVVGLGQLSLSDLMKRYFAASAPFSAAGAKKDEFPDAVTLLSIEAWAAERNFRVLAISGDKDWAAFAAASTLIDVVPDIAAALSILKGQSDEARVAAGSMLDDIDQVKDQGLVDDLSREIGDALSYMDVSAEAHSYMQVEAERPELSLYDFSLTDVERFQLIEADDDLSELVVEVSASLVVDAEATLYLSVHDSIDDDYVSLGGVSKSVQQEVEAKLLITFRREGGLRSVERVEITKFPSSLDFGEVEPDYSNDYYDEEPPTEPEEPSH